MGMSDPASLADKLRLYEKERVASTERILEQVEELQNETVQEHESAGYQEGIDHL